MPLDDLLEAGRRQRTGLAEDEDAVAEAHDRRDRGDLRGTGERLLGLGVDLAEDDVVVLLARLLVGRRELAARAAPRGPPVDEHDVARRDGLLEGVGGELDGGHAGCSSFGVWVGPPERTHRPPGGAFPPGADRCGTPAPPHIIPIRHDGDVPHTLTAALDAVLDGLPADPLRRATASLVDAYRSGAPPTAQVLRDPTTAAAYAAYRMPATHAAVSPGPAPRHRPRPRPRRAHAGRRGWGHRRGDAGRRPRPSRRWSASTVLDGSADALALGARIGRHGPPARSPAPPGRGRCSARASRCPRPTSSVVSYLLGELPEPLHAPVVDAAVAAAAQLVLVVEPGTPRGYAAVLAARSRLTAAGWHLLAPCPQDGACPVAARPGDWCHFAVRLDRSAAAPPAQGRPARPRGREVLLRARVRARP